MPPQPRSQPLPQTLPQPQPQSQSQLPPPQPLRRLVIVLGDQLNRDASAFDGFDATQDAVWMAEVAEESTHVVSAKQRTVMFLSAMRHFAAGLQAEGLALHYRQLDAAGNTGTLAGELAAAIDQHHPAALVMTASGDWRVLQALRAVALARALPLAVHDDRYFYSTVRDFSAHAQGRKQLRMEYFYREQRLRHRVLMDPDNPTQPLGGQWNFDADNRAAFGRHGPGDVPPTMRFAPDAITLEVMDLVKRRFADHPGQADRFGWPVTRAQALQALDVFIRQRLPQFGQWQDAMWAGQPWLYHAHLGAAMNCKLLSPQEVVARAEAAYHAGQAPLPAVEGFIRQILGWREYVRGIYWTQMPGYAQRNALGATADLPAFYWTGDTPMACLRDAIGQTLEHGYAHHIQRLMVTGLYALLLGVRPLAVHAWYLAVYVDAVEWVELPNTLGMGQFADGGPAAGLPEGIGRTAGLPEGIGRTAGLPEGIGQMASKPYVASGKYIDRMSNHCAGCRFKPGLAVGDDACPFTTLYWDFLDRHQGLLARNPRMALQLKNLARLDAPQRTAIGARAAAVRAGALDRPAP